MANPPRTEEGWYALHDFRSIDWDAWRAAPDRERELAVEEGVAYLEEHERVADAEAGASAAFSVLGHKADLMIVHFRPTLDALSAAERRFESTALADFTEQPTSYVSVTEVSDYVSESYFDDDDEETDEGIRRYIEGKLKPEIPDTEYVSFYPMNRKREVGQNWYSLPYEERADLLSAHGEIGREYAGKIKQVIASSVGLDDYEWGVTLFGGDPADIKDIVYEMRFDEASAEYGEFGPFYIGRRFPPTDLGAYLDGEQVPTSEHDAGSHHGDDAGSGDPHGEGGHHGDHGGSGHGGDEHGGSHHGGDGDGSSHHDGGDGDGGSHHGDDDGHGDSAGDEEESIRAELEDLDIYAGQPHGEDVFATVLYSEADPDELFEEVEGLRGNFEHYGTHVKTAVYTGTETDRAAVVSIWDTASAAETAAGFLSELPGIVERAGEESGFGTMGMFYTVKSEHREDFVEKFDVVGDVLADMDGHHETDLMVNREDENDMFIASQWASREDAMGFFRSDDFRDTVSWGRDVLADRPRHVFLA
ncbi:heme-binding protein [Halobaculum sp. CBA1158]|uniref:heme-binding protein n=1 Tax=Halobaculum sp. CBA1158 TaxID=2904243 RepID=UPI001F21CD4C|nr:heme-binding protein [Halobaculum sp. CBA1158]UIO99633.1 heme-binding protein [Halobaculum sp. CBA1158]